MPDITYTKRINDRKEGRLLRTLPAFSRITPFFMRRRSDATCTLSDSIEVTEVEKWLRDKRGEGWSDLGFTHLLVAAYVRTVSMRPGINRFVAGRKIFARNDIQVILTVKRGMSEGATQTTVKVSFSPSDTVFDVYRRLSEAVDAVKADVAASPPERIAGTLCRLPRFALRLALMVLRWLDFHDWLPNALLEASPFHGSLNVMDFGSLGTLPAEPHLPDFGSLPLAISYGAKRRSQDGGDSGRGYVDLRIACDERIADSFYFAGSLKCLKYFMKNPSMLELPPETITDDIN